jgi:hypothetical protein
MTARFWAIGAGLVIIVIVAITVLILKQGNKLAPAPTATPPLEFNVTPVTPGSASPTASSSACPLTGNVAVNESQVSGGLELNEGTAVTSVTVDVLRKRSLSASAYQVCASTVPGFAGNPDNAQVIQLPTTGDVEVPGLDHGGSIDLIVRPPAAPIGGAGEAIAYTWQITVNYTSGYGPGSDPQGPFTLLVPAS